MATANDIEITPIEQTSSVDASLGNATLGNPTLGNAPVQLDQEWANALTHGIATVAAIALGIPLVRDASGFGIGLSIACGAYAMTVIGTFFCSTLSHVFHRQPMLDKLRAWDQAMIYTMITGTYTPIAFQYASEGSRTPLLLAIWVAAIVGFLTKVAAQHRINSISAIPYLLLGWLPAIPLAGHVPTGLVWSMAAGGVLYSIGVAFLLNDAKFRYAHAVWHLFVMSAAACHFLGILWYVVWR